MVLESLRRQLLAGVFTGALITGAAAQQAASPTPPAAPQSSETAPKQLPEVEVSQKQNAPVQTKTVKKAKIKAKAKSPTQVAQPQAAPKPEEKSSTVDPAADKAYGPVDGVAATDSGVGSKTSTPINQIPQTINVVTRKELDQRDVQDFNSALAYTPGIRVVDYPGGQGSPDFYIRGIRSLNFLGLYRDGLRGGYNSYDTNIEMFGIERVDVVKGPTSVLYGQNAPGGLVNLISKRPTEETFNEVSFQYGSFDRAQTMFDFSGPADSSKTVLYRFNGLVRDSDSQVDHSPDDRVYLAPSLTIRPDSDTSLTLLGDYIKVDRGGSEQSLPIFGTLLDNPNGKIPRNQFLGLPQFNSEDVESWSLGYDFTRRLNENLKFHSVTRYTNSKASYDSVGIADATYFDQNRFILQMAQDRDQSSNLIQTDNNIEADFNTGFIRHKMLAGFDYANYHRDETRFNSIPFTTDVYNPDFNVALVFSPSLISNVTNSHQTGYYIQDQAFIDRWILTGGVRYDISDTSIDYYNFGFVVDREDTALTYRAGIAYEFDNGITPYFSYSTSFLPQLLPSITFGVLEPTEGKQYEVGIKYVPPGSQSFFQISAFDITQTNLPSTDALFGFLYYQIGEVNTKGIEVEGKTALTRNLDVVASYTYLDAVVTKDDSPAGFTNIEGNRLPTVPRNAASLWMNYRFTEGAFNGLQAGAGVRYIGNTTDAENLYNFPGYTVVDAAVSYDLGRFSPVFDGAKLTVSANNLFDKHYYTPTFYPGYVKEGFERTVLGTISYRW